jgi:hypothetical protein
MATMQRESTPVVVGELDQEHRSRAGSGRLLVFEVSPEMDARLEELCKVTGLEMGELINRAVGLYKVAVEAAAQGKHVGIATSSDALEKEYTGFGA